MIAQNRARTEHADHGARKRAGQASTPTEHDNHAPDRARVPPPLQEGGTVPDGRMNIGVCAHCARLKRLDVGGLVVVHMLAIDVSRRAIRTVGAARVRRRCPGSRKPPRRVEP